MTGRMKCPICDEELPERKILGIDAYSTLGQVLPSFALPLATLIIVPVIDLLLGQSAGAHVAKAFLLTTGIAIVLSLRVLMRRDLNIHRSHLHSTVARKREEIEEIIAKHAKDEPVDEEEDE